MSEDLIAESNVNVSSPPVFVRGTPAQPPVPLPARAESEETESEKQLTGGQSAEKLVKAFNRTRKANVIMKASDLPLVNHISTGIFYLDLALLGGFCENSPFMIYGLESSAKTTLILKVIAQFQRKYPDKYCGWVDAEMSFDKIWAEKNGVDLERLLFCQPESGEEGVDATETMLHANNVSFVAVDSIPALVPIAIKDRSAEDKTYGGNSALIGNLMCKSLTAISEGRRRGHYCTLGIVNQIRDNLAIHGSPYKMPGGRQLRYQTQTWVRMKGLRKKGRDAFGNEIFDHIEQSFVIEKNKCGTSLVEGEYKMSLNPGICQDSDIPEGVRISMTQTYEASIILAQGKRMGLVTGGGGNWRIQDVDQRFSRLEDMQVFLYRNPQEDLILRRKIIGVYRRENKLPAIPPDGYLLD